MGSLDHVNNNSTLPSLCQVHNTNLGSLLGLNVRTPNS